MPSPSYTLILLRHGQSTWNQLNLFTGWVDVPLSDKGISEAKQAGILLKKHSIYPDVVYTSWLRRSINTANLCLDECDRLWIPVKRAWELNERHYGGLQGKNKYEAAREFGEEQVHVWRRSYDVRPPPSKLVEAEADEEAEAASKKLSQEDADEAAPKSSHEDPDGRYAQCGIKLPKTECLKDVLERAWPYWLSDIVPDLKRGMTVLVAAHGNSLRAIIKGLEGISDEDIPRLEVPTGVPILYELNEDMKVHALKLLESRRRRARPKSSHAHGVNSTSGPHAADAAVSTGARSTLRGTPSLTGMKEWLQKIGYTDVDIAALNIIHVAGTKGKGSTCAFVRSLLQEWGKRTGFPQKIGLYTSPDLTCIRERIQINGQPISEDLFAKYFFDIWDRLFPREDKVSSADHGKQPRYLQLLALLAIHTFCQEGTQATIFETHHGGEYDATNVLAAPVVTGITSIGLDHLAQLGPTVQDVAWHKAGIFKTGALAFSAPQTPVVEAVLRSRAEEKLVPLEVVQVDDSLSLHANALRAPVQRINCSLAIALVNGFLSKKSPFNEKRLRQQDIENGIEHFSWPGRFETINTPRCTWYLDGAHNELSIGQAVQWFAEMTNEGYNARPSSRMVIFSHVSEERDGPSLLRALAAALEQNDMQALDMVFTTYQERRDGVVRLDKTLKPPEDPALIELPKQYCDMWQSIQPDASTRYEPSIEEALEYADQKSTERGGCLQVLVTGSLHLVGGALYLLQQRKNEGAAEEPGDQLQQ